MPVKYVGVERLSVSELQSNVLSANEEDTATFNRLKEELGKHGLVELPVVLLEGGQYRIVSGHHRTKAWGELGHLDIDSVVLEVVGSWSQEEEFNLVNNLNQVRGQVTTSTVKRVVRAQKLDVTKLDLFKFPVTKLLPNVDPAVSDSELSRRAKIRDMAVKIAPKIAEILLEDLNTAVVVFRVEDAPVAIIRVAMNKGQARKNVCLLKSIAERTFMEWLSDGENEVHGSA